MSRIHGNPEDYLRHVTTRDEAARLHDDLSETIDYDRRQPGSGRRVGELQTVLRQLEDQWDLVDHVFGETAGGKPRPGGLGPRGKSFKRSGRATTRTGKNKPPARPRAAARPRAGRAKAAAAGYALGRRHGRRRYFEQTGLPAAGRSATSSVLFALGSIIALAVLYDVLRAPQAPTYFLSGLGSFLRRLVLPVDPLAPIGGKPEQGAHLADPVGAGQNLTKVATNALKPLPKGVSIPGVTPLVHKPLSPGVSIPGVTPLVHKPGGHHITPSQLGAALLNEAADRSGAVAGGKVRRFAHPNRHRGHHH